MSAIDNKHLIEIFSVNVQSGVSRKTGNPYEIHKAQCLVHGPDKSQQIGELNINKEIALNVRPGRYLAEFELAVDFNRLVVPRVTALHPYADSGKGAGAASKAAA